MLWLICDSECRVKSWAFASLWYVVHIRSYKNSELILALQWTTHDTTVLNQVFVPSCPDVVFDASLIVTDLHQQGADHGVDLAHFGDGGHLVATQYVGLQGLCADLHIHLTCVHTRTALSWKQGCTDYRCLSHGHILCAEAKQLFCLLFSSLSSIHPSSPCFLSYSPSLIPICCLIILPLPLSLPSSAAHNPSHRGQVQITPRGRGFWVFRQRYYLTC